MRLIARPNDVSTTSAPSSCACLRDRERDRRVVEHAGDEDPLVAEQHWFLSSWSERRCCCGAGPAGGRASSRARRARRERTRRGVGSGSIDRVDVAALGGAVRVVERALVLVDELALARGTVRRRRAARSRRPCRICTAGRRAHHRDLAPPGHATHTSLPTPRESMTMYAPPYALRSTTQIRGTVAAAYACTSSAPWRIMPAPFEVAARLEAGRVDEREDRQVERVAPRDEARGLARCLDVERARAVRRLVRDDADRCGRRAARDRSRGSARSRRAARASELGVEHVVDHGAHVVRTRWRGRERSAPRSCTAAIADRRRRRSGRIGEMVVGQVGEQRGDCVAAASSSARPRARRHRCGGRASPRRRARSRSTDSPVKSPTASGPLTNANASLGHHDLVEAAEQRAPDRRRTAPMTASSVGTTSRHARRARGRGGPTRASAATPSRELRARGVELADERNLRARARELHRALDGRAAPPRRSRRGACRPRPGTTRPAGRRSRAARPSPRRRPARRSATADRRRGSRHEAGTKISAALWPPKPNEFDSAGAGGDRARLRPRRRRAGCRRRCCSRFAVGGTSPLRDREQARDGFGRARGADEVAGDALGRRDGRGECRRTPCGSPRLRPRR